MTTTTAQPKPGPPATAAPAPETKSDPGSTIPSTEAADALRFTIIEIERLLQVAITLCTNLEALRNVTQYFADRDSR